jgi:sialate O-acetylesterase
MFNRILFIAGVVGSLVLPIRAEISLPSLLSDHMVVQRGIPVHIWGKASLAEEVSVFFRGETRRVLADELGRWSVYLMAGEAGGPFELSVRGRNTVVLKDVWSGDVWIAAGQSNMEWKLKATEGAKTEIATATTPGIRFFRVKRNTSAYPLEDVSADGWVVCAPESAPEFSAVAYFFGQSIHQSQKVSLGLIDASWGGTPLAAFTSIGAIARDASLMPVFSHWAHMADDQATNLLKLERERKELEAAAAQARREGKSAPEPPWHPDFDAWAPGAIYNAMIAPLTLFPIRGTIWYQGESDASPERAPVYARLFQTMIRDWRRAWGIGDFPFLFVQLTNFIADPDNAWPELREAQRQALTLSKTGMAVTIDIGTPEDIHPKNKKPVGMRLALAARAIAYDEKIEYSGPLYRQATTEGQALRVWFDHAGGGLVSKGNTGLKGFEIAGADRKFVPAESRIEGSCVIVSNPNIPNPRYVRYGWLDNPEVNLFNKQDLPASPFRSEE